MKKYIDEDNIIYTEKELHQIYEDNKTEIEISYNAKTYEEWLNECLSKNGGLQTLDEAWKEIREGETETDKFVYNYLQEKYSQTDTYNAYVEICGRIIGGNFKTETEAKEIVDKYMCR